MKREFKIDRNVPMPETAKRPTAGLSDRMAEMKVGDSIGFCHFDEPVDLKEVMRAQASIRATCAALSKRGARKKKIEMDITCRLMPAIRGSRELRFWRTA